MDSYLYDKALLQSATFDGSGGDHHFVDFWVTGDGHTFDSGELQEDEISSWIQKVRITRDDAVVLIIARVAILKERERYH